MRLTQLAQVMPSTGTLISAGATEEAVVRIGPDRILQGSIKAGGSRRSWTAVLSSARFGIPQACVATVSVSGTHIADPNAHRQSGASSIVHNTGRQVKQDGARRSGNGHHPARPVLFAVEDDPGTL